MELKLQKKDKGESLEFILSNPFCIYGAGIVAMSIYTAVKTLYRKTPIFFLVSDVAEGKVDENPLEIDGIPVKRLSEWQHKCDTSGTIVLPAHYLVVAPETHHSAIAASLHSMGIEDSHICLFTSVLENQFMDAYYSSLPDCCTVSSLIETQSNTQYEQENNEAEADTTVFHQSAFSHDAADIRVFQAKCHVDRVLQHPKQTSSYVCPIQVGADLTEERIAKLCDNTGENISAKNRNYCELTATYYAWKNSQAAYKGLCHYRRIFEIDDGQMQSLLERRADWDVILPYPSIHYPNISTQHTRYIKEADWEAMLQALKETAPDYLEAYQRLIENGEQSFFNFNMLIARAEVFDDYCSFLFSVLERAEALTTPKGWERTDRFAGYMGENLTTIYFLKNRDKLRIAYAGKKWLT